MIDEQIAFCLLITTQKADDHRRLGPCKTMAQIPFDSSPEGPNERSKCPKHRERGQENFFRWPLKYITQTLQLKCSFLKKCFRWCIIWPVCNTTGLENANSEKDGICGHWLMEFCVSVLRVCIVKFSTTATPLRRRYQSFFSWVPINDSSSRKMADLFVGTFQFVLHLRLHLSLVNSFSFTMDKIVG